MKKKLSITIEKKKIKLLDEFIQDGRFRNKSHLIEYSLDKFLKGEKK
jgi:Arc/MetJ-type ribon-helix-helix transcriptional regulator